jgi:hypothetical protein
MDLVNIVNRKIRKKLNGIDKTQQVQSTIHKDIIFKRNSINLLISRRGVGKTFTVMRELIKLSELPACAGFTQFIYITDKTTDATVNELIKLIKLKVRVVKYENAVVVLKEIMEAKTEYEQIIKNDLEDTISENIANEILRTIDVDDFYPDFIPNSAILMDDAMNIFNEAKFKTLRDLIFQNRQPKFTIFICIQDFTGIPSSIKRNVDTVWIFAGFTDKTAFGMLLNRLGSPVNKLILWEIYIKLGFRDAILFDYEDGRIVLKKVVDGRCSKLDY